MDITSLRAALPAEFATAPIWWPTSLDSTNEAAKRQLEGDIRVPFIVGSDKQTAGVGQRGHRFDSPDRHGLYVSFALPMKTASTLLMPAAGVAVANAARDISGRTIQLKWVNDLFIGTQKIGGILTWLHPQPQAGLILGIGVNLTPAPGVRAIDQPTGTLFDSPLPEDIRPQFVGAIATHLCQLLANPDTIMPAYRALACWVGLPVTLTRGHEQVVGKLVGFADDGGVLIASDSGQIHATSGSLRPLVP